HDSPRFVFSNSRLSFPTLSSGDAQAARACAALLHRLPCRASVLRGLLQLIDHQEFARPFAGFHVQAKLLSHCGDDGWKWWVIRRLIARIARPTGGQELQMNMEKAGEARLVR